MSTTPDPRPERCEICRTVLAERSDPRRRRCAEHRDQLALLPLGHIRGRRSHARRTGQGTSR